MMRKNVAIARDYLFAGLASWQKRGMLWVDRVRSRRSHAILTQNFLWTTGDKPKRRRNGAKKKKMEALPAWLLAHGMPEQELQECVGKALRSGDSRSLTSFCRTVAGKNGTVPWGKDARCQP
jgi:hypothetical protein